MTADDVASVLRSLADEIEAKGKIEASFGNWTGVSPREPNKLEMKYKHNPNKGSLSSK